MRVFKTCVWWLVSVVFLGGISVGPWGASVSYGDDRVMRNTLTDLLKTQYPFCGKKTQGQRFVLMGRPSAHEPEGVVCDNGTGLYWEGRPALDLVTLPEAESGCANLLLGGRTWRLTRVQEYLSLVVYQERKPFLSSGHGFNLGGSAGDEFFWTATPVANWDGVQWVMNIGFGNPTWILKESGERFRAWCVSGDSRFPSLE